MGDYDEQLFDAALEALGQAEDEIRDMIAEKINFLSQRYDLRIGAIVTDMMDRGDMFNLKFLMIPDFILSASGIETDDGERIPVKEWLDSLKFDRRELQ